MAITNGNKKWKPKVTGFRMPEALISIAANSVVVYPQAYNNLI